MTTQYFSNSEHCEEHKKICDDSDNSVGELDHVSSDHFLFRLDVSGPCPDYIVNFAFEKNV